MPISSITEVTSQSATTGLQIFKVVSQGPSTVYTSTENEQVSDVPPSILQTTVAYELVPQGPPETSTSNEVAPQAPPPTSTANELVPQAPPPTSVLISQAPPLQLPNQLISQAPPPMSMANELISHAPPLRLPNQLIPQGLPPHQPSPPSLHANEELLSEDSEVEMEATAVSPLPSSTLPLPLAAANAARSRSDSGKQTAIWRALTFQTLSYLLPQPHHIRMMHRLLALWLGKLMTPALSWMRIITPLLHLP